MDTTRQLAYIAHSMDLLTVRLYSVPMSRDSRRLTKDAIDRLASQAQRIYWGLPRFPMAHGYSLNVA
jgi:hypothetical protein